MDNNKKPDVTVVMPTYNSDGLIGITTRSILEQNLKNIEVIIVDDASSDKTQEVLTWYMEIDKRIKVIRNTTRKGAAYSRNRGNRAAKANYIMVIDAGDLLHPTRAGVGFKFLEKNKDIDCYYSSVAIINSLGKIIDYQAGKQYFGKKGEKPSICHPTMMYRKKTILEIPYTEGCKDTDQYERMILEWGKKGKKFAFTPNILVHKLRANHKNYRNLKVAYKKKYEIYRDFGIEIPAGLQHFGGK